MDFFQATNSMASELMRGDAGRYTPKNAGGLSMRNLRFYFLFSCLTVLGACASSVSTTGTPCPNPGMPSPAHESCWYLLKISKVDAEANRVTGTDRKGRSFTFRVRDVEILKRSN